MKAGGEEDSLSSAFEKEMSLWTIVVDGGPPAKKKRAIEKGKFNPSVMLALKIAAEPQRRPFSRFILRQAQDERIINYCIQVLVSSH